MGWTKREKEKKKSRQTHKQKGPQTAGKWSDRDDATTKSSSWREATVNRKIKVRTYEVTRAKRAYRRNHQFLRTTGIRPWMPHLTPSFSEANGQSPMEQCVTASQHDSTATTLPQPVTPVTALHSPGPGTGTPPKHRSEAGGENGHHKMNYKTRSGRKVKKPINV